MDDLRRFLGQDKIKTVVLSAQKVNDTYRFAGITYDRILMERGVPTGLDGDDTLDYVEKTGITNTSKATQIDEVFVHADLVEGHIHLRGTIKVVARIGVARTGSTSGDVYVDEVVFSLGKRDSTGNFHGIVYRSATPNFSTDSTDYQYCDAMTFLDVPENTGIRADERLALEIIVKGHVVTTESGKMRLNCTRGSSDTYLEMFMGR